MAGRPNAAAPQITTSLPDAPQLAPLRYLRAWGHALPLRCNHDDPEKERSDPKSPGFRDSPSRSRSRNQSYERTAGHSGSNSISRPSKNAPPAGTTPHDLGQSAALSRLIVGTRGDLENADSRPVFEHSAGSDHMPTSHHGARAGQEQRGRPIAAPSQPPTRPRSTTSSWRRSTNILPAERTAESSMTENRLWAVGGPTAALSSCRLGRQWSTTSGTAVRTDSADGAEKAAGTSRRTPLRLSVVLRQHTLTLCRLIASEHSRQGDAPAYAFRLYRDGFISVSNVPGHARPDMMPF